MTDEEDAEKRAWLIRLFNEYAGELEGFLRNLTRSPADACELTQETYLQLLQVKDFRAIRDPKSYMYTIGRNLAVNLVSQRGRREGSVGSGDPCEPRPEEELPDPLDLPEEIADGELLAKVREAFSKLRPEQRAAWHLKYGHGMTYEEIATHLNVSKDTVKKYLQQVILLTKEQLHPEDHE